MPQVSIVMPAHRLDTHQALFEKAIRGIVEQSYENFELVIILDGNHKESVIEAKKMLIKTCDQRIKLIMTEKNYGNAVARNVAFWHTSGKYIMQNDSDDFSYKNRLEILVHTIENTSKPLVASVFYQKQDNPFTGGKAQKLVNKFTGSTLESLIKNGRTKPSFFFHSALMTRDFFKKMGGYEKYRYSSDSIFAIKVGLFNDLTGNTPISIIPEPLFDWNRHLLSITNHGGKVALELKKCQDLQRAPIIALRKKFISGELPTQMTEEEAIVALGITDIVGQYKDQIVTEIQA